MSRLFLLGALAACGNSSGATVDASPGTDGRAADARAADAFATLDAADGTPTRQPCTSHFGTALPSSPTFGRLDGYLVAVVDPSSSNSCNADDAHVHLQIQMNGAIYDVAIDVTNGQTHVDDVHSATRELPLPNLPWSEGFHTGVGIDYANTLDTHAADLPLLTKAQLTSALDADLATANHISVYATTYGSDGAHLVHRNSNGRDGLIVTQPLSAPAHLRLFSFTDQSF